MGTDKLGLHILNDWAGDLGRPRAVKLVDASVDTVRQFRAKVGPEALIVIRWVEDELQLLDRPEERAEEWFGRHWPFMRQLADDPNVLWEGYNEADSGNPADPKSVAYCRHEVRRLQLLHEHGLRAVAGNFARGTPHETAWATYQPMLAAMLPGDYLGLHEYWWHTAEIDDRWLCARWTLMPELTGAPILVTECGRESGGWQASSTPAQYLAELRAYNGLLEQSPNVLAGLVFSTTGPGGTWASYDPSAIWPAVVGEYSGRPWRDVSYSKGGPMPEIKLVPSPNWGYPRGAPGRAGHRVRAIVYHVIEGTLAGLDSYACNPKSGVSYHFCVGRAGQVHQYVSINNAAWHAGHVANPSWSLLLPGINPNLYTVGVAREGYWHEPVTEAAYRSIVGLTRSLLAQTGLAPTADTLIGHYRIDSVNKDRCPGPLFPWARLFQGVAGEEVQPVNPDLVRERAYNAGGVPYNKDAAFPKYAREHGLGNPVTPEFDFVDGGVHYRGQGFSGVIIYAKVGEWQSIWQVPW